MEEKDHHIVIIDRIGIERFRILYLYKPQGGISPESFFTSQFKIVRKAMAKICFVMGDFNLDARLDHRTDHV